MTYRHECRNCRWCYQITYDRFRCAKHDSGRQQVKASDWCMKWQYTPKEDEDE